MPIPEFLRNLEIVGAPRGRFLDLGCGLGTKLLLAYQLGWTDLNGVEHNPGLAAAAQRLLPEANIVVGDALSFDCGGHEVIYTYRLCEDLIRQELLAQNIFDTATPGALVIYAGANFGRGEYLGESVWRI